MNWKVNTIATRNKEQYRLAGAPPIRMTPLEGALERRTLEVEDVDISHEDDEIASSFLVALQKRLDSGGLRGESPEIVTCNYSVNLVSVHELITRVCAELKRNHLSNKDEVIFTVGNLCLDSARHQVQKRGLTLHLTPKEFALLHSLMMHAGQPVSHQELLRLVWGSQFGCQREYLRFYVRQLRIKIEDNPANPKYLLTEPSIGYRFAESVE